MRMRRVPLGWVALAFLAGCENDSGGVVQAAAGCGDPAGSSGSFSSGGPGPASAAALLEAMGAPPAAQAPVLTGAPYAAAVFGGLGVAEPTQGADFAWLSTGVAGANTPDSLIADAEPPEIGTELGSPGCGGASFDCVTLQHTFVVPEGHTAVRFDFAFFSTEYPEYLGAQYNDTFLVSLASPSFTFANISFDSEGNPIEIESALFTVTECGDLEGSGFELYEPDFGNCDAGATGLLGTIAPVAPGETATLTFTLYDAGDRIFDSAVFLDRLETTETEIDAPQTDECD